MKEDEFFSTDNFDRHWHYIPSVKVLPRNPGPIASSAPERSDIGSNSSDSLSSKQTDIISQSSNDITAADLIGMSPIITNVHSQEKSIPSELRNSFTDSNIILFQILSPSYEYIYRRQRFSNKNALKSWILSLCMDLLSHKLTKMAKMVMAQEMSILIYPQTRQRKNCVIGK